MKRIDLILCLLSLVLFTVGVSYVPSENGPSLRTNQQITDPSSACSKDEDPFGPVTDLSRD